MKRNTLTYAQKQVIHQEIVKRRKAGISNILDEISEWAQTKLKLPFLPSKPVLFRLSQSEGYQCGNNAQVMW